MSQTGFGCYQSRKYKRSRNNVIKKFGQLDILVNNAGISIPTTIDDENYEESWDKTFDVLLKGQVNLIRAALPFIRKSIAQE
ncbi:MAG: hypothetical protein CM1200mP12_17840 [Gammaproteobacteria bacterium]|nr:MAG: hypothetical protein CM1200mP12_17840 [Gammaproteobacteria bacterium]